MLSSAKEKTVIFDLDGTIVDTGTPIANTINHVRSHFDLAPMPKELILEKVNCPHTHSPMFFYEVESFTDSHIELFESYYHMHCVNDIELYDGMEKLLEELQERYNLAVATNASSKFAKKILESQNLLDRFDFLIGADMVKEPKPHPEMLHSVIEHFGHSRDAYLFIGDSQKDELAASRADIPYVMVEWGFSTHSESISSTQELRNILLN